MERVPAITVRKPRKGLWVLVPIVALGVFWLCVPHLRLLGIVWLAFIALAFLWQPLQVRVTSNEVVVSGPLRSARYDLREVKYVTVDKVPAGHGTTMASVRLDFFHGKSVQIAGFTSRTKLLYEAISAAWRYGSRDKQI